MLILALQVVISSYKTPAGPPVIEHQVIGRSDSRQLVPIKGVGEIQQRAKELALTRDQLNQIQMISQEWKQKSKPLDDQANAETTKFRKFMDSSKEKTNFRTIRTQTSNLSELSRQLADLRHIYWDKALQVLDAKQRRVLDKLID
jgi:Spy/CpxP family protein refolding chaperone